MALYIDFDDLTPEAHKRLLKEMICGDMVRQLPMSKREAARARMHELTEDEDEDDLEREELVALKEQTINANTPALIPADFGTKRVPSMPPPVASKSAKGRKGKKA